MRLVPLTLSILLCAVTAFASEIREFDLKTIERLGRELSRRDAIAARAADVVLETQPIARALKMCGWITDVEKNADRVYLITDTPSGLRLAYAVAFSAAAKPQVTDCRGKELPTKIAVRFAARQTAAEVLKGKLYNIKYNFEVLDDPDGSGFLVYALGASTKADEVVLAGHFRVTVSADGEKAERVDALSRTLKVVSTQPGDQALWIMQLVSDKPVETFIYLSKLHQSPIFVGTPDRTIWKVDHGEMKVVRDKKDAAPTRTVRRKIGSNNMPKPVMLMITLPK